MIRLKPVIAVRELPPACSRLRQHLPSLRSYVAATPHEWEPQVLAYLRQGEPACIYPDRGMLYDVLEPGKKIALPPPGQAAGAVEIPSGVQPSEGPAGAEPISPYAWLTDGVWIWPGALIYYVARYHLRIDPEFIHHARMQNWRIDPSGIDFANLHWDEFN